MPKKIASLHTAKSTLSQLVKRVSSGEVVPIDAQERPRRRIGVLEGKLHVPDDLDAPLPDEVMRAFEGGA